MVILLSLAGIIVFIVVITVLNNIIKNWNKLMNYKNLFTFFIVGAILLSIGMNFMVWNTWINSSLVIALVISSLFYGAFKK